MGNTVNNDSEREPVKRPSVDEDALFKRLMIYGVILYLIIVVYVNLAEVAPPARMTVIPLKRRPAKLVPLPEELSVISPEEMSSRVAEGVGEAVGEDGGGGPQDVGARGVLGILTGLGVGTQGDPVEDILGSRNLSRELDGILEGLDGLQRGGTSTSHLERKASTASSGGIDDLMGDVFVGFGDARLQKRGGARVESFLPSAEERFRIHRTLEEINKVVQQGIGGIEYCYNLELRVKPDLNGKITVSFIIGSDGVVEDCSIVSSTLNMSSLESCIKRNILRWRFVAKEGVGNVEVVYPIVFFPKL
jgi:TonB family protein